ncbi:2-keto-3-deoxy-galactonokinase [Pseudomonas sp. PA15(2017)]|uniref:2-dehydro-3-deoxygalactonokinase n=1 Tax=Pseudomonas sp. PA15(2017) TaxID=1932111 RepID=UPI00096275C9|nr:2-dehydro-3-deoxygalactonokinase [Pseudomonas sp. PA15(2017)]OLU31540.1 2-keto-3-deoxy-galactonokinase [Pseudomonas sp. PA15(2017)]
MSEVSWIAVDWGTTQLRAWALAANGNVLHRAASASGMGSLAVDQFEAALLELIDGWLRADRVTEVVACGMVGARQGWREAPYAEVPCAPQAMAQVIRPEVSDARLRVSIIAGLCQRAPADVLRGEETQIAGLLAEWPDYHGLVCLPGTHSKWAEVRAGQVTGFQTFMTGELFALLSGQSVLRHGMQGDHPLDLPAFDAGLCAATERPLLGALFGLRAESLLEGLAPAAARSRLSGLLIGQELAGLSEHWQGLPVCIIGDGEVAERYRHALTTLGIAAQTLGAEQVTLAGLAAAHQHISGGF